MTLDNNPYEFTQTEDATQDRHTADYRHKAQASCLLSRTRRRTKQVPAKRYYLST